MEELKKIEEEENIPMEKMKTPNEKIIDIPTGFFFFHFFMICLSVFKQEIIRYDVIKNHWY